MSFLKIYCCVLQSICAAQVNILCVTFILQIMLNLLVWQVSQLLKEDAN